MKSGKSYMRHLNFDFVLFFEEIIRELLNE